MAKRLRSKRVKRSKLRRKSFKRNIHRRKTKYQKKTMRRRKTIRRKAKYTNRRNNMYGGNDEQAQTQLMRDSSARAAEASDYPVLHDWLRSKGLGDYTQNFIQRYYFSPEDLIETKNSVLVNLIGSGSFEMPRPAQRSFFKLLEEKRMEKIQEDINQKKYSFLLKLFDRAEIINVSEF